MVGPFSPCIMLVFTREAGMQSLYRLRLQTQCQQKNRAEALQCLSKVNSLIALTLYHNTLEDRFRVSMKVSDALKIRIQVLPFSLILLKSHFQKFDGPFQRLS